MNDPSMPHLDDDASLAKLTSYSVGFLRSVRQGTAKRALAPCGSGVLIEVGGIKGILTAAHVIRKLAAADSVGLFTIHRRRQKALPLEFDIQDARCLTIGERDSPTGPDLGFLRLPFPIEQRLINDFTFYNFDLRLMLANQIDSQIQLEEEVIVGVIGERSKFKNFTDTTRTDMHTMSHIYGTSSVPRLGAEGLDIFDFTLRHNDEVPRPTTYGGLSGAAVWRLGAVDHPNARIVVGIAFYETQDEHGTSTVVCHGPRSIYGSLVAAVRTEFDSEFIEPVFQSDETSPPASS